VNHAVWYYIHIAKQNLPFILSPLWKKISFEDINSYLKLSLFHFVQNYAHIYKKDITDKFLYKFYVELHIAIKYNNIEKEDCLPIMKNNKIELTRATQESICSSRYFD